MTKLSELSSVVSTFSSSITQFSPHFTETILGLSYLLIELRRVPNERNQNGNIQKRKLEKIKLISKVLLILLNKSINNLELQTMWHL